MKISLPKILLHAEGLAVLIVACTCFGRAGFSWTWFAITILLPDAFLLGYLAGARTGALVYNFGHTYLAPLVLASILYPLAGTQTLWVPLVWMAHIGLDRALGFGLKYPTTFKDSHLARV